MIYFEASITINFNSKESKKQGHFKEWRFLIGGVIYQSHSFIFNLSKLNIN